MSSMSAAVDAVGPWTLSSNLVFSSFCGGRGETREVGVNDFGNGARGELSRSLGILAISELANPHLHKMAPIHQSTD